MEDLKAVVASALEKKGILSKIRAQLRAHVFQAIEQQQEGTNSNNRSQEFSNAKKLSNIASTPQALLVLDLIKEWLEFYELDYTNSTLLAEAKLPPGNVSASKDRSALISALHLHNPSPDRPVLVELLMQNETGSSSNITQQQQQHKGTTAPGAQGTEPVTAAFSTYKSTTTATTTSVSPPHQLQQQQQPLSQESHVSPDIPVPRLSTAPNNRGSGGLRSEFDEADTSPTGNRIGVGSSRRSTNESESGHSPTGDTLLNAPNSARMDSGSHSPNPDTQSSHGPSGRRRRDRNFDLAAVHTLVQAPTSPNPAHGSTSAATTTSSSSSLTSHSVASLATNKSALHAAPDVPIIDLPLGEGSQSDLEASNLSMSADAANSSMDADQKRLEQVNRMISSYQNQLPSKSSPLSTTSNTSNNTSSEALDADPHAPAGGEDEDEDYGDEEFAASEVVEENIEVEEEPQASRVVDDSMDGEFFNSSSSLVDQAARAKSKTTTGGRRAMLPPSIASEGTSSAEASHEHLHASASASADADQFNQHGDEKEAHDLYSEDASVNEPLENQFDYTEEVEHV